MVCLFGRLSTKPARRVGERPSNFGFDQQGRLGAFFNTNGSVAALLVALFNLGIATLIYLPFVVVANKAQNAIDKEESEEDIANALKF